MDYNIATDSEKFFCVIMVLLKHDFVAF